MIYLRITNAGISKVSTWDLVGVRVSNQKNDLAYFRNLQPKISLKKFKNQYLLQILTLTYLRFEMYLFSKVCIVVSIYN